MKNLDHQKKYFNKIAITYHKNSENHLKSILRFFAITKKYISGDLLDIGNGGIIGYDTKRAKSITIADIASETIANPKHVKNNILIPFRSRKLKSVTANVLSMPFKKDSFNTVVMVTTAHHLSVLKKSATIANIHKAFNEINRVLKNNGIFIIHECFLNPILKMFQEIFFTPAFYLLSQLGKPLPYFMSEKQLTSFLKINDFKVIEIKRVQSGNKVYVPLFTFLSPPGWLWDIIQPSKTYICKKITDVKKS
jgi:ubiquinone/menaquinone biosynthesis C-methylase UbiE